MPRSLYDLHLSPYWRVFFESAGYEVVREKGSRADLPPRVSRFENELCLPVKYHLAQVESLLSQGLPLLFAPLVTSTEPGVLACPKMMMTQDLIRVYFREALEQSGTKLIDPLLFAYHGTPRIDHFSEKALELAEELGLAEQTATQADQAARTAHQENEQRVVEKGIFRSERPLALCKTGARILLLGHIYSVHNEVLNNAVVEIFARNGLRAVAKEHYAEPPGINIEEDTGVDLDVWFYDAPHIFRAANLALEDDDIGGIVYLGMFNCGFDAVIEDILARRILSFSDKPYLHLILDEHSSVANLATKIEVFKEIVLSQRGAA